MRSKLQSISLLFGISCVHICISPLAAAEDSEDAIIEKILQIEKMPRPAYGPDFVKGILIRQLVEQLDPSSYDMAARQLILPGDRSNLTSGYLIPAWIRTDPKQAFEFFKTQDPEWFSYSYTYELLARWATFDPDGALAAAKSVEVNRKDLIEAVLKVVAVKSPSRALEILPEEYSSQYGFVGDAITYWAGYAPEEAAKWVMTQPKRGHLLWNLGYMWALESRPDAEKWVKTLDDDDHTFALAGMIEQRAKGTPKKPGDPIAATHEFMIAFPNTGLDQETLANQAVKSLAYAIANNLHANGADSNGMKWVQSLKSSPGREDLLIEMIGRWIEKSPKEALPYIQAMEPGKVKETALCRYIRANWKGDPHENFKLSTTVIDQKYRIAIQADVFQQWLLREPEIAIKSLKSLPDEEETEVRARITSYAKALKRQVPREN
jgi:hypothetical protein